MLLSFELKKIIKRISLWGILGFLFVISVVSLAVTYFLFGDRPQYELYETDYMNLAQELQTDDFISNSTAQQQLKIELDEKLDGFHTAYRTLNTITSTGADTTESFTTAHDKFTLFRDKFNEIKSPYWLFQAGDFEKVQTEVETLHNYFDENKIAQLNTFWENIQLFNVLFNMTGKALSPEQLTELNLLIGRLNENDDNSATYINCAYKVLYNNYALAVDENVDRNLAEYSGFTDYNPDTARTEITLNEYLLANNLYDSSARAFNFGDIYNGSNTVSLFDFIFTNLEIIGVPLAVIAIIFMSCAFFTDIYTHTIIESVSSRRRRISVVISKISAVILSLICVILILTAVYTAVGILFFHATVGADIVVLFNNDTPSVFTQVNYFVMYLISLLFKLSVFILAAGLFSLSRVRPNIIVGLSLLTVIAMLTANALLGGIIFYQFVPLLALEPIKYFGATLFMSPMPADFNILYTLPLLFILVTVGFFQIVYNFSKKDF